MKFKPPRALFVLIICALGIGYFGYGIYERRIAPPKPTPEPAADARAATSAAMPVTQQPPQEGPEPLSTEDYVSLRVPRIPDVPSSAPIYDEITRPVTYPQLSCLHTSDPDLLARNHKRFTLGHLDNKIYGCRCNTQQGTRAVVSFDACMAYVNEGAFDPAKPDRLALEGQFQQPAGQPQLQPASGLNGYGSVGGVHNVRGRFQ